MHKTDQEKFWAGDFGDEYIGRNQGDSVVASNTLAFAQMLRRTEGIASVLELGANIGMNLQALHHLLPHAALNALEINRKAYEQLRTLGYVTAHHGSVLEFVPAHTYDLVFTKGVLIHLAPDSLISTYRKMAQCCRRWVLICEYYNPVPVEIAYRGHSEKLFKRDFCGEFLAEAEGRFRLTDYGFFYHKDPLCPQDDATWFLLERKT